MISIDDTCIENMIIADIIKEKGLEKETIFFADFIDGNANEYIKYLHNLGFQIGSHTVNHLKLTDISDDELETQLNDSKKMIEEITGKPCIWFAYPYGLFNNKIVEAVKKAGYKYARTCKREDDGEFKLGCFEMSGKNWSEAMERKYAIYQMHYYNLEQNNSFNQFNQFLTWYKDETNRNNK